MASYPLTKWCKDTIYAVLALARDTRLEAGGSGIPIGTPIDEEPPALPAQTVTPDEAAIARRMARVIRQPVLDRTYIVDYSKPFYQVCRDFLKFVFLQSKSLDIICRAWAPKDPRPDYKGQPPEQRRLPSWILNTTGRVYGQRYDRHYVRINADPLVGFPGYGRRVYNASSRRNGEVTIARTRFGETLGDYDPRLYVDGFILSKITQLGPEAKEGVVPNEWLELGDWTDMARNPPEPFWRTLVADRGPQGSNPLTFYPRACRYVWARRVEEGELNTKDLLIMPGTSSIERDFLHRLQAVVWRRRLVRTEHGYLGLVHRDVREGDLICILLGCSVPVVLRPQQDQDGERYHRFLGECYVHSMMDGEAMQVAARSRTTPTFELR